MIYIEIGVCWNSLFKMQNRWHIYYSFNYIFKCFSNVFRIFFEYFLNIIRICWKCKTCVISLYNIFEYYPNIFWILFLYVESAKQCHIHYSIFLNFIRIFLESYSYILKCKTCVIFIIQLYIFLNIIRIFSESYSYMLKM